MPAQKTITCGDLTLADAGRTVTLMGWLHRHRDHSRVIFIDLRDRWGITQLVVDPEAAPGAHAVAETVRNEYVLAATGVVRPRPEGTSNAKLSTGEIEVHIT